MFQNPLKGQENPKKEPNVAQKDHQINETNPAPSINAPVGAKEAASPPKPREEVLGEKITDLTLTLQRLQAEFENYQKRTTKQTEEHKQFANANMLEQLLPVLDSLEQGVQHSKDLVMINDQLITILKKNGLAKIEAKEGVHFNHETMDCLITEKNEKQKNDTVSKVLLSGYKLHGKVLRPAKVSIVKNN
ncbi:MAG: nucleotide exchange factor GrpE [archaeon]